jgi:hypothetical protein
MQEGLPTVVTTGSIHNTRPLTLLQATHRIMGMCLANTHKLQWINTDMDMRMAVEVVSSRCKSNKRRFMSNMDMGLLR